MCGQTIQRYFCGVACPIPDTLVPGGPEIDVGISTVNALILVEAKWQSGVRADQGKTRDKDQIQLRGEFLKKHRPRLSPNRSECAVVGVSLVADAITDTTPEGIAFRSTTWERLCSLESHPQANEVWRYFEWKKKHTRTDNQASEVTARKLCPTLRAGDSIPLRSSERLTLAVRA